MHYDAGKHRDRLFRPTRRRIALPLSLIVLILAAIGLWLIPTDFLQTSLPINVPAFTLPPPTPSITPIPRPTPLHGGRIVFTCTRGLTNHLCMIGSDGTHFQQLTTDDNNDYYPVFSPQGDAIVYASNYQGGFDLFRRELADGKTDQLTFNIGNAFSPSFSPDGGRLVFVNRVGSGPYSLWVMGLSGEPPHQIYAGSGTIVAAAWSPSADRIAFAMSVDQHDSYEIFLLSLAARDRAPERISRGLPGIDGSLVWSQDAKNLLFCAGPLGFKNIYRMDIGNDVPIQLTDGGNNAAAAYSVDARWIVFNSLRNGTNANLYIMRSDGSDLRQLTNDSEPDWQPQWEP
jgi:TolB protein